MGLVDSVFSEEEEIVQTTLSSLADKGKREIGYEVKKKFIYLIVEESNDLTICSGRNQ